MFVGARELIAVAMLKLMIMKILIWYVVVGSISVLIVKRVGMKGKLASSKISKDFNELVMKQVVKLCPNCRTKTEKNLGCDHMKCNFCQYEYCWICLGKYSADHFQEESVNRCPMKDWEVLVQGEVQRGVGGGREWCLWWRRCCFR